MQFQYNSDYPDGEAQNPPAFDPAQPIPCARITTRIYHPSRNQVATVQNVLVKTLRSFLQQSQSSVSSDEMSSSSSSSSDMDTDEPETNKGPVSSSSPSQSLIEQQEDRAYWVQRTVREAIYGRVMFAVVLKRRTNLTNSPNDNAEWEVTSQHCAVKEMSWQHIRRERDRLAEDPIKEVSAMQYFKQWHAAMKRQQQASSSTDSVMESFSAMLETNIMMPLDLLSDDRNLYSIMPYCDGGELFERLDLNERFSEDEARYWMHQVLNGLENLQDSGICHRDMSLENLLVHETGALIIDMGMCLRIPFRDNDVAKTTNTNTLSKNFGKMNMNGGGSGAATVVPQAAETTTLAASTVLPGRATPRWLIRPQGTCGKWIYMSPEIYKNKVPFDGYAVDMWAAGVILFLMLTGFPPWERACQTDERFKYMTAGYLVQMLTEWEIGISSDAMDLLQRMLWLDPKDRLSLDQVREHPWMKNGQRAVPLGLMGAQLRR